MKILDKFLKYIYSSNALTDKALERLEHNKGIFKHNFFRTDFRKPIIHKVKSGIEASDGGVFLISGYRGTGKTTFINYVLSELNKETSGSYLDTRLNLSSAKSNLKYELINRIVLFLNRKIKEKVLKKRKISKLVKAIEKKLLWDESYSTNGELKAHVLGLSKHQMLKQKDNFYFLEDDLQSLLRFIRTEENKKIVFILDELDKLPLSLTIKNFEAGGDNYDKLKEVEHHRKLDWLLDMLSEIKSFLFESGVIFILIVNKDVYDYWRYRQSQEDLFMNLVTDVVYIPCYKKEEMKLHDDFQLTFTDGVKTPFLSGNTPVLCYFTKCLYYESYANPRLFFQHLSRYIKNGEICLDKAEIEDLKNREKLFELNDLLYDYVYENKIQNFQSLLLGLNELRSLLPRNGSNSKSDKNCRSKIRTFHILLEKYRDFFETGKENDEFTLEFWKIRNEDRGGGPFFYNLEAVITILKDHGQIENFPAMNYVIRRLTDFLLFVEKQHFISIKQILKSMCFQPFEYKDIVGKFLINVLLPLNILFLYNSKVIWIEDEYICYNYSYHTTIRHLYSANEWEFDGNLGKAFEDYKKILVQKPYAIDIHEKKFRLLYYMIKLGYEIPGVSISEEWEDSLKKLEYSLLRDSKNPELNLIRVNYLFFKRMYRKFFSSNRGGQDVVPAHEQAPDNEIDELFEEILKEQPTDAILYQFKGFYLFHEKKCSSALKMFQKSYGFHRDPFTLIFKGDTYADLKCYQDAINSYFQVLEDSNCWLHKALAFVGFAKVIVEVSSEEFNKLDLPNLGLINQLTIQLFSEKVIKAKYTGNKPNYYYLLLSLKKLKVKLNFKIKLFNKSIETGQSFKDFNEEYGKLAAYPSDKTIWKE